MDRSALRVASLVLAIAMPLWVLGISCRGLWTPDEPREADIAWRMSWQANKAIPELAGSPIAEKPPLTYWLSAAAIAVTGLHPWALRIPNLLLASLSTLAIALLAFDIAGRVAAWVAGLVSATFLLSFQVAIWLATDAAVVCGVSWALLGTWLGLESPPGRRKALFYQLGMTGLLVAFMAKGPGACMVPAAAFFGLVLWERRWRELIRWELWASALIPLALGALWAIEVLSSQGGEEFLRTMFWYNLFGRFMHLEAPDALQFAAGHRNYFGKYLVEGVLYLFPWTLLCIGAIRRVRIVSKPDGAERRAWRFLACAVVIPAFLLSVAATARGIYAAPILPAIAIGVGFWAALALPRPDRVDRGLIKATFVILVIAAVATSAVVATIQFGGQFPDVPLAYKALSVLAAVSAAAFAILAQRRMRNGDWVRASGWLIGLHAASMLVLIGVTPVVNRMQDLLEVGRAVIRDSGEQPILLYRADETTLAFVDLSSVSQSHRYFQAQSLDQLKALLQRYPGSPVMLKASGKEPGSLSAFMRRNHIRLRERVRQDEIDAVQSALGLDVRSWYALPDGRKYVLLSAPRRALT